MKLKITQVEALPSARLRVSWASGKQTEIDAGDYLRSPGYERLGDPDPGLHRSRLQRLGSGTEHSCRMSGWNFQLLAIAPALSRSTIA